MPVNLCTPKKSKGLLGTTLNEKNSLKDYFVVKILATIDNVLIIFRSYEYILMSLLNTLYGHVYINDQKIPMALENENIQ